MRTQTTEEQGYSPLDFHHGKALLEVANRYSTLIEVILESIQNALDALAGSIHISVNFKKRSGFVNDDGNGTSKSQFEKALQSICQTMKDETDLGQFGMGLISPLGKCESFTFTSTPKSDPRSYIRWTFTTDLISAQDKIHSIPHQIQKDLHFERNPSSQGGVPWRTQVKFYEITRDRIKSKVTLPMLRDSILERYSTKMRRNKTTIYIEITSSDDKVEKDTIIAEKFRGKRLPVEYIREDHAGRTTFNMFIATKTNQGRQGKVMIGEDGRDFRLNFRAFAKHASDYLSPEIIDALTSGTFEGEILSEKAKLDSGRRHFELNEALVDLCITIGEWFKNTGIKHLEKIKEETQDQKYQILGLRSIKVLEALLDQPEFAFLREVVKSFKVGTIGIHHTKPDAKIVGLQPEKSTSSHGEEGGKSERSPGSDSGGTRAEPETEHKEHTPFTVTGPKGRQRMLVKSNSIGLQFLYSEMEGSDRLWDLDMNYGILQFNTRHPLWAQCEVKETVLMRFQEQIAIMALTLETVPREWKERHRQMVDDMMPSIVFLLLNGDEIAGRKFGRKSKTV